MKTLISFLFIIRNHRGLTSYILAVCPMAYLSIKMIARKLDRIKTFVNKVGFIFEKENYKFSFPLSNVS